MTLRDPFQTGPGSRPLGPTSLDRMFVILSHPYRRRILTRLADYNPRIDGTFTTADFADEVDDLDRFTRDLYHEELPKLAAAEYIQWEPANDDIRHGSRFSEIAPLVALMRDHADELPAGWP